LFIVFAETGLFAGFFLPGDSLLFVAGIYSNELAGEILLMNNELKKLVNEHADIVAITEQAYKSGMKPLRLSGAMKVAQGLTTIDEVLKVAPLAS
jgi:type II secretory ATPase GspE/PulE/Tfp pilus assembly ATPase PilB-like protein